MDGLWLHHAPAPGAAGQAPPAWMDALVRHGARMLPDDLPSSPPDDARWVVLSNPVFTPDLAGLAQVLKDRGGGIAGAFETPDFDLGLWAAGPLRGHPVAPQGDLLRHVRDLARSIALCDVLFATGPSMAARLSARNPAARVASLPPVPGAPVPAETERRRIVFAVQAPSDRVLLRGHETLLARAAEVFDAELLVSEDAVLPDALRDHPKLATFRGRDGGGFGPRDVVFLPASGDGAWQRMRSGEPLVAALTAGAALWGAIPEQLRTAPAHMLIPHRVHWEQDLRRHFAPGWPRRAARAVTERRWHRATTPLAAETALIATLASAIPGPTR